MGFGPISVELNWPAAELSPNGRAHPMAKARKVKDARQEAYWSTKIVKPRGWGFVGEKLLLTITAYPTPLTRNLDDDNFIARCKSFRDGIAEALGIDDNVFAVQPLILGEPTKRGRVVITIGGVA